MVGVAGKEGGGREVGVAGGGEGSGGGGGGGGRAESAGDVFQFHAHGRFIPFECC